MTKTKTERPARIEPDELIPDDWKGFTRGLHAATRADISFLGKPTVRRMVQHWRSKSFAQAGYVAGIEHKLDFLADKTIASLQEEALQFELPLNMRIGYCDHDDRTLRPIDTDSRERIYGSTTLNICGWCRFAGSGTRNGAIYLRTNCPLLADTGFEDGDWVRAFNSPCFVHSATDRQLRAIRRGLTKAKSDAVMQKREIDRKIRILLSIERQADDAPSMPESRPTDWFDVGDRVVCYIGELPIEPVNDEKRWPGTQPPYRVDSNNWVKATVIPGHRHHHGAVYVNFDRRVHNGEFRDGCGSMFNVADRQVVLEWEFRYLLGHPEFAVVWATKGIDPDRSVLDEQTFLVSLDEQRSLIAGAAD